MPANSKAGKAERKLAAAARRKGMTGKHADRYKYGAMNNMGLMRGNKVTAKGRAKATAATG